MKSSVCAVILSVSLLCFGSLRTSAASDGAVSVTGGGTFSVGNDKKGHFNFNAVTHADGSVTGHLTLHDPEEAPNQDVDGNDEAGQEGLPDGAEVTAELDSVKIDGKRAALSGIITSASSQRYLGLRMILTVEDSGEGKGNEPDKITWGFYQRIERRLVADDENPDAGAFPVGEKFLATDAERPEEGAFLVGDAEFDSQTFPLSSYALNDIHGGNIQVHGNGDRQIPQ